MGKHAHYLLLAAVSTVAGALPADYPTVPMRGVSGNVPMPLVGLGTAEYNDSVVEGVIQDAFKVGFRHVDTAFIYKNQVGVGRGLKKVGLKRENYFVTSKIPGGLHAGDTEKYLDACLEQLDLGYVDLMLIHFPADWDGKGGPSLRKEEWRALEKWALSGKARAIGVSHYCKSHIDDVLSIATVPIALNQVMYHVGMGTSPDIATDYKDYMAEKGIVYMSFSTLCGPCTGGDDKVLINGPLVTEIGSHYNVTGPQVALRWAVQQGIPVVPKSQNPKHLAENFDLFSFNLSAADMARLTASKTPAWGAAESGDCKVALHDDDESASVSAPSVSAAVNNAGKIAASSAPSASVKKDDEFRISRLGGMLYLIAISALFAFLVVDDLTKKCCTH